MQTIIPLSDDSGLRLTTARYYTPQGTSIQARGITPDIVVSQVEVKKAEDAEHFREKDLKNHFETSDTNSEEAIDSDLQKFNLESDDRNDYQLMRALDLLKGLQIFKNMKSPAA